MAEENTESISERRYEFGTSYVLREYKTLYEDGNIDIN